MVTIGSVVGVDAPTFVVVRVLQTARP